MTLAKGGEHRDAAQAAEPTRRDILSSATRIALGAAAAAVAGGALAVAYPRRVGAREVVLGRVEVAVGSMVLVREHALFLVRTDAGLGAMSARCTHLGCVVRESGDGLSCPCHGGRFDRRGRVTRGPAPRDLPWLALSVRADGGVTVDLGREVAAGSVVPVGGSGT